MSLKSKIIISVFLAALIPCILPAAEQNLDQEFGNMPWGTEAKTRTDLKKISGDEDLAYYTRTDEPYSVYGADLGRVIYGFFQGRFFSTYLDIAGKEKFERTLQGLKDEYGPPRAQYRVGEDVYIWETPKVKIKLKRFDNRKVHKLAFYYIPLARKINEEKAIAGEEIILKSE